MHEVSLGGTLRDYLTGEAVERTTYEDLRQALARLLVEERGFPRESLRPKVDISFRIDDCAHSRSVDYVAYGEDGRALLVVLFCAGAPGAYERETLSCARLISGGPAPLALVTDTRDAVLLDARDGARLGEGVRALPTWTELLRLAAERPSVPLESERRSREERILHTYTGFLKTCCGESCPS